MAFFNSKKTAAETPIPEVMEEHMLKLTSMMKKAKHSCFQS